MSYGKLFEDTFNKNRKLVMERLGVEESKSYYEEDGNSLGVMINSYMEDFKELTPHVQEKYGNLNLSELDKHFDGIFNKIDDVWNYDGVKTLLHTLLINLKEKVSLGNHLNDVVGVYGNDDVKRQQLQRYLDRSLGTALGTTRLYKLFFSFLEEYKKITNQ